MKTNKQGYPVKKQDGKWVVLPYTETPPKGVHVIERKTAAERMVKEWNEVHG